MIALRFLVEWNRAFAGSSESDDTSTANGRSSGAIIDRSGPVDFRRKSVLVFGTGAHYPPAASESTSGSDGDESDATRLRTTGGD